MSEPTKSPVYHEGRDHRKPFAVTVKRGTASDTYRFKTREDAEQAYSALDVRPIESSDDG